MTRGDTGTGAPAAVPERILAAAQDCYRTLGISKTTMGDVAKQAGLSRPTIYRHFATRDELVAAVVVAKMRVLLAGAREFIDTLDSVESKVADGLLHVVAEARRDPVTQLLFDPRSVEATGGLDDAFNRVIELTTELWQPVFERGQSEGELAAEVDIGGLCSWFVVVSLITARRANRSSTDDPQLRATLVRFVAPALRLAR